MKKALLVGINRYPDPRNELKGCVNDVRQMAETLKRRYGFPGDRNMRILTDARATTKAILDGLAWLTAGASPGDSLVFHYSGHGSQVPDRNGDETSDRLDEILERVIAFYDPQQHHHALVRLQGSDAGTGAGWTGGSAFGEIGLFCATRRAGCLDDATAGGASGATEVRRRPGLR